MKTLSLLQLLLAAFVFTSTAIAAPPTCRKQHTECHVNKCKMPTKQGEGKIEDYWACKDGCDKEFSACLRKQSEDSKSAPQSPPPKETKPAE